MKITEVKELYKSPQPKEFIIELVFVFLSKSPITNVDKKIITIAAGLSSSFNV